MTYRIFFALILMTGWQASTQAQVFNPKYEYIILTGAPTLYKWEQYKPVAHDQFWGGFARASRTRVQQLRKTLGPDARITWLVYGDGYRRRSQQDKQDLISNLNSVRDAYKLNLIFINSGQDVINYINSRPHGSIGSFEYFGHSNRACFMFDYSNIIDSGSKAFLHESQLGGLRRGQFARDAFVKSWGCHTGESFAENFHAATGAKMWGAMGKTDYSNRVEELNGIVPVLSSPGGEWVLK